jgi:hypothetical protein
VKNGPSLKIWGPLSVLGVVLLRDSSTFLNVDILLRLEFVQLLSQLYFLLTDQRVLQRKRIQIALLLPLKFLKPLLVFMIIFKPLLNRLQLNAILPELLKSRPRPDHCHTTEAERVAVESCFDFLAIAGL